MSAIYHPDREILSRLPEKPTGPLHRTNYGEVHRRSKQLANALQHELGVALGTVVGTLAFNTFRHLEAYFGISGIGAILHTINPRLFIDQIEYIVNRTSSHTHHTTRHDQDNQDGILIVIHILVSFRCCCLSFSLFFVSRW